MRPWDPNQHYFLTHTRLLVAGHSIRAVPEPSTHFFLLPSTEGEGWPWGWVRRGTATPFAKTDLKQCSIAAGWHRTTDSPYRCLINLGTCGSRFSI